MNVTFILYEAKSRAKSTWTRERTCNFPFKNKTVQVLRTEKRKKMNKKKKKNEGWLARSLASWLADWLTGYCRIDSNQKQMNEYLCLNFNLIRRKSSNQKQFMPYAAATILLLFTILWVMKSLRIRSEPKQEAEKKKIHRCSSYRECDRVREKWIGIGK